MGISNPLLEYKIWREKSGIFCVFLPLSILGEVCAANHFRGKKTSNSIYFVTNTQFLNRINDEA